MQFYIDVTHSPWTHSHITPIIGVMSNRFSMSVKKRRLQLGLSQEKLAEVSGLDRTYISGIERGIRNPSLKSMERIARALKVSVSDLV